MNEIFFSEEMKRFEKLNFIKKNSYFFMKRAGYQVFKFIFVTKSPSHNEIHCDLLKSFSSCKEFL